MYNEGHLGGLKYKLCGGAQAQEHSMHGISEG